MDRSAMGHSRRCAVRQRQLWTFAATLVLAFNTCHSLPHRRWAAAARRDNVQAAGRLAGTVRRSPLLRRAMNVLAVRLLTVASQ